MEVESDSVVTFLVPASNRDLDEVAKIIGCGRIDEKDIIR